MATVNDILNIRCHSPICFGFIFFLRTHTNTPARCVSCWHLLFEWKAALAETMGVYPAHIGLLSFVHHKQIHVTRSLLFIFLAKAKHARLSVCALITLWIFKTATSHVSYAVLPVLTNTKRTIVKSGLTTLHIFLILLGFSPYIHYVETVLFTVPLRPIYVNGLCYDWLIWMYHMV